jgi:hypothetical protein
LIFLYTNKKQIVQLMEQNILYFRTSTQYAELVEELQAIEAIGGNSGGRSLVSQKRGREEGRKRGEWKGGKWKDAYLLFA